MTSRAGLVLGLAAALAAAPAAAQPSDQIAALLEDVDPARPPVTSGLDDLAYDARLRASMASAQAFQGSLDGGWRLAATEGDLYAFQLVDRGMGIVEGAWRDVRRPGALDASGFVDRIERLGPVLVLHFAGGISVARLRLHADGTAAGELAEEGRVRAVTLRRAGP